MLHSSFKNLYEMTYTGLFHYLKKKKNEHGKPKLSKATDYIRGGHDAWASHSYSQMVLDLGYVAPH